MDEIQNCIADAQYGEALRGMDSLRPSERVPNPPPDFDVDAFARKHNVSCASTLREPLGIYLFGEEFLNSKPCCDFMREVCDLKQNMDPEERDVLNVVNGAGKALPSRYKSDIATIGTELKKISLDSETWIEEIHGLFDNILSKMNKEMESNWPTFVHSERYQQFIRLKWYEETRIDIRGFTVFRDLGRGAFGVVSGARLNTTGTLVAIKCMNRRLVKGKRALKLVQAERNTLATLGEKPSDFTVWLKYAFADKDMYYLCLPLCTGGDLGFHLQHDRYFSLRRAQFHAAEICLGLQHLHGLGVLYRDLKPENILLDDEGHARISDMGLATFTGGKHIKGRAGTPGYWAPEMLAKKRYGAAVDWWSFGCVVYEFLAGKCPFSKQNTKMERDDATLKWEITYPDYLGGNVDKKTKWPTQATDILSKLLERDPKKRIGTKRNGDEIRTHPFFAGLDWELLRKRQLEPPWKPRKDMINAGNQSDIDEKNNEYDYRKLKLLDEDNIKNFEYCSRFAHQTDIINVLEMEKTGQLEYLDHSTGISCCIVS